METLASSHVPWLVFCCGCDGGFVAWSHRGLGKTLEDKAREHGFFSLLVCSPWISSLPAGVLAVASATSAECEVQAVGGGGETGEASGNCWRSLLLGAAGLDFGTRQPVS